MKDESRAGPVRSCPGCGAEVGEGERFCASCGARLPEAQPPAAPTLPIGRQEEQPAVPPPSEGMHLPADVPPAALPSRRKGLPIWAILLLGLAGLCVLGCVAAALFVVVVGQEVAGEVQTVVVEVEASAVGSPEAREATAGPEPPPDVVLALPTRAPTLGGAGGIVGGGASGAAGQVQVAQTATALAVASAEAEALLASARIVFQDEFVDNRNAWFTGVFQEIETDTIEDGVFKVIWAGEGTSYELWEVEELGSFIAEVDCLVYRGGADGSCGLVFDTQADGGFYKYELFDDYFRLFVVYAEGEPTLLAEGNPEGLVRPGEANRMRVVRQGDTITIFVNDGLLAEVRDLTYLIGKVGVSTNSYSEGGGVEVWFDNFTIWELPS